MREPSPTLKAAQEALTIDALVKIVLTHGASSYTYERDRILDRNHPEEPYSQKATVILDNSDGVLTNLALQGFKGVISYGAITSIGEEYSACAPLWVIGQQLESSPGELDCVLSLIGIPNLLATDKASRNYIPDKDDTKTIETLLIEILGATLGCFSHCKAYEVVIDSRDSLINTYKPKDSLRIYKGNSRLAIAKRLLDCTECVMLAKADGKLHIFVPTISGVVYNSEYSIESGHTFFSKAYRKALVIPNYIYASSPPHTVPNWVIVTSDPYSGDAKDQADIDKFGERKHTTDWGAGNLESDEECAEYAQIELNRYIALHDPYYEGIATDPDSIAALASDGYNGEVRAYWQASFESDDQAKLVAEALLAKLKLNAEMGAVDVPINVGTEVYDYVKVAALCAEDVFRVGTLGSLTRHYNAEEAEWRMSFSLGQRPKAVDVLTIIEQEAPYFGRLIVDNLYAKNILADSLKMVWIDPDNTIDLSKIGDTLDNLPDGEVFARVKTLHLDAGQVKLDENILYKAGYDPHTKRRNFTSTPTTPYDVGDLWHSASVVKRCTTARATGAYVAGDWTQTTIDAIADGTTYQRAKSLALTAGGMVILDQVYIDSEAGAYDLVARVDISAHHVKLSSTIDGGGYKKYSDAEYLKLAGVAEYADVTDGHSLGVLTNRTLAFITDTTTRKAVSASEKTGAGSAYDVFISKLTAYGLSLWTANSSTRVQLTSQGLKGYAGGVVQVEIKASDGRIYAGGGQVILSASGLEIKGTSQFKLTYGGSYASYIYVASSRNLVLSPSTGYMLETTTDFKVKSLEPDTHESRHCGYVNRAWYDAYIKWLYTDTGAVLEYQGQDDIAMLKAIKGIKRNGRRIIDARTLPQDLIVENKRRQKYINIAGLTGFNIGVEKALLERIEALEAKVA